MLSERMGNSIVIEIGSSYIRGGFAGEHSPRFTIPTLFVGLENASTEAIRNQCTEALKILFLEYFQLRSKDCQVLVVENLFACSVLREQLFHVLLQDMQVQMVSFQPDMMMSMLSTGCSSGIVLDISSSECRALAIAHGRPLLSTFTATASGVNDACRRFRTLLSQCWGEEVGENLEEAYVRDLFERVAVALPEGEQASDVLLESHQHRPGCSDGAVPGWVRHQCLDTLIRGCDSQDGESRDEAGGAVGVVLACLLKCGVDLRRALLRNLVICGGGAGIPGVADAVWAGVVTSISCSSEDQPSPSRYSELRHLIVTSSSPNLPASPFDRTSLAWIGGSLFASIKIPNVTTLVSQTSSRQLCNRSRYISRDEYIQRAANARVPDWTCTDNSEWNWRFFGATASYQAPVQSSTPSSGAGSSGALRTRN